jgi:hypothetical protein
VVGFDSIIPPGRAGTATEEINLGTMHGGTFSKSATITSNAKNMPTMQISMKGTVKEAVSVSPDYIQFNKDKNGKYEAVITLTSEKVDLKIEEIAFKENQTNPNNLPAWQKELPIPVSFSMEKDPPKQNADQTFKVKITLNYSETVNKTGEFIFKTNHPDAPEVKANGTINAAK